MGADVKLLAGIGALGMLGGGLYATDSLTPGTVYDKPYDQAYAELSSMSLLPVTGPASDGTGSILVERSAGAIGWRIAVGAVEVGRFTARLSPVGANRTRVIIDFAATPVTESENPLLTSELMTSFARLAMVEQVDARLENRAPDMHEIHMASARHLQANPAQLKDFGGALRAQFKQVEKRLKEDSVSSAEWDKTISDIKADTASPPRLEDATRPSVVFPAN